jgi:hypothetical protein
MSIPHKEQWEQEVIRSLKLETLPEFKKYISGGEYISPFSVGTVVSQRQRSVITSNLPFLAIQNYSELLSGGLTEWIENPNVGLRFRQLEDVVMNKTINNKHLFLSQPFLFVPKGEQEDILSFIDSAGAKINMGWSPLSFGLTRGEILKKPLNGLGKVLESESLKKESTCWFYLSSAPYQWAGAEPHAELGILLSVAYEIIKEMNSYGASLEFTLKKMSFGLSLGTDVLVEPAKIIALKVLLQKLLSHLGDEPEPFIPPVYAMPSLRTYSARQPWNNVMRSVLMCTSAITGGAEGFKCIPYDVLNTQKQKDALRVSTNVPLVLTEEARLSDVKNPLDGSPLFDAAVESLCLNAWDFFKEMERKGGILESVRSGWLQMELKQSADRSAAAVNDLQFSLVGVNEFVDTRFGYEKEPSTDSILPLERIIDPLFLDKTDDEYLSVQPLLVSSLTYDWEFLQQQVKSEQLAETPIVLVKVPSPTTEKRMRKIISVLNIIGCKFQIVEEEQLTSVEGAQVAILVGADQQKENQISADIRETAQISVVNFVSEISAYDIADRLVQTLLKKNSGSL